MTQRPRFVALLGIALATAACAADGGGTFAVTATGSVAGTAWFDADGSGGASPGDAPLVGLPVRLLLPIAHDTIATTRTDRDGRFAFSTMPVGSYALRFDAAALGDSLVIAAGGDSTLTVRPSDSLSVVLRVTYPTLTASQVQAAPLGTRAFVAAVALHARTTFGDTLLHVVDSTGYLRVTRLRTAGVVAGDSLRLRGRIALRDGRRVLDDVTAFGLGAGLLPAPATITTAQLAAGAVFDAALVRIVSAAVVDTITVLGNLQVTVNDGSGPALLWLDRSADAAFRPPFLAGTWDAGRRYDVLGIVVPLAPNRWVLRPRSAFDLTPR